MGRSVALSIVCLVVLLFDFYCLNAVIAVFKNWKPKTKRLFSLIWWAYSFLLIIGVFASIFLNLFLTIRAIILVAFFLTVVCKLVMLPFLIIDDLRRLILWVLKPKKNQSTNIQTNPVSTELSTKLTNNPTTQPTNQPITRSSFLIKVGLVTAAIPLTSLSWGIVSGAYDYKVKHVPLILPNLPKAFNGLKLAQISDVHSGSFYNKKAVLGGIETLLAQKPDLVFFTGDLVNNFANEMRDYQDIFAKIKAPLGVFSVLGNHDYGDYHFGKASSPEKTKNLKNLIATHKNMGWNLLMNQHHRLKINGEEIGILGIENWGMGRFAKYGKMELATKNTEDLPLKLLLSHDPSHWRGQVLTNYPQIDAMFSGHTHGMQFGVRLKEFQWSPVQFIYKEWAGLYQQQQQQLYVNVGYGFLGYPGRVGILPEITIFELKQS